MEILLFLLMTSVQLVLFLGWGFKYLPGESWQIMAVVPFAKKGENGWRGANLTYYGFFVATSQLMAIGLLLVLLGAVGVPLLQTCVIVILILVFALPAARLVAIIVEKKRHTFTVGGASFVGILVAPPAIALVSRFFAEGEVSYTTLSVLAALSIAYTLGEGLGRLGCISYGCCYGRPLKECTPFVQWVFQRTGLIFYGKLKKVSYEANLEGERLIPIQALTSIVCCSGAMFGVYLFLHAHFVAALLFTISLTQLWRIYSETLRADFRGFTKISAYQKMGILSVFYVLFLAIFLGSGTSPLPLVMAGLESLWNPAVILLLQLLWLLFFVMFGRSTITRSTVSFQLCKSRI